MIRPHFFWSVVSYTIIETNQRVDTDPDLVTRFRWRADRRCRKLNANLRVPFYRWEVEARREGGWAVVAMQNVGKPQEVTYD